MPKQPAGVDVTAARIAALGDQLNPDRDYLIIPVSGPTGYLDKTLVSKAVATGVPVWVSPVHRRIDTTHFFALGCQGAVCAGLPNSPIRRRR